MSKVLFLTLLVPLALGALGQRPETSQGIDGMDNLIITSKYNTPTDLAFTSENENPRINTVNSDNSISGGKSCIFEYPFSIGNENSTINACCKNVTVLKDLYWGWNFNFDHKNGIKNCFEVGVGEVFGYTFSPWKQGPSIDVGLGFGMRRYLVQNGKRFEGVDNVLKIENAYGMDIYKSRVDSWTFHIPVMFTQKIYKQLAVSAGAWINFNTYVKGETQYYVGNIRYKEQYKGFNQRFCTVDVVAVVGIKNGIGFYGRWSPMSLFEENRGPEFRSVSMGVMLNF